MTVNYCIDYHEGTYLLSSDTEDQVREAVVTGSPDVEIPDILERYLENRSNRNDNF